jgi:hypothetical protein
MKAKKAESKSDNSSDSDESMSVNTLEKPIPFKSKLIPKETPPK